MRAQDIGNAEVITRFVYGLNHDQVIYCTQTELVESNLHRQRRQPVTANCKSSHTQNKKKIEGVEIGDVQLESTNVRD